MRLLVSLLAVFAAISWVPEASASDGLIHGCVNNRKGSLRIVGDPSECKSRETPLSWNQQGPQGEPGVDGVDGLDGMDGMDGAPGPTGPSLRVLDANGVEVYNRAHQVRPRRLVLLLKQKKSGRHAALRSCVYLESYTLRC